MALRPVQTVEATTEVAITPQLQRRLRLELAAYAELKSQETEVKEALEVCKTSIEALRDAVGAKSFAFEDSTITLVDGGTTKTLNVKKLLAKGLTLTQIADCYVETPKKPHTLVTLPKRAK